MYTHRGLWFLLIILLVFSSLSASPVPQVAQDGRFFPETGHWVTGKFLAFYEQSPDPLLLFGYPLSEAHPHPIKTDITIQYFQRVRLEYDPAAAADQQVRIAPLGEWLYDSLTRGERANFAVTSGACRPFDSGLHVCYAFLNFYDLNQGAVYFGQPISDVEILDGRLVQYFERARLEWRPEMPAGQRVALTDLGRLDMERMGSSGDLPADGRPAPQMTPLQLRVFAFAEKPLMRASDKQTIFVVVQDQLRQPVQDAEAIITVVRPDGSTQSYRPESATNVDGFTKVIFDIDQVKPNDMVKVQVKANVVNGPENETSTWFRIWW